MTFQGASFTDYMRGIQETFKALFVIFKSVILSPYVFFIIIFYPYDCKLFNFSGFSITEEMEDYTIHFSF